MFSANTILQSGGLAVVALVIFAETGLLVGIIFPGDSLLLAGGLLASQHKLNIYWLVSLCILAAIVGYQTGYYIGRKAGPRVFSRQDGLLFKKEYIERTRTFLRRHGGKTILFARFIPYVRTFVSVIAGVGRMDRRLFAIYNVLGGILWVGSVTLASYWLGSRVPNVDKYLLAAVVISLVLFHSGLFWHVLHDPARRKSFKRDLAADWHYFFDRK